MKRTRFDKKRLHFVRWHRSTDLGMEAVVRAAARKTCEFCPKRVGPPLDVQNGMHGPITTCAAACSEPADKTHWRLRNSTFCAGRCQSGVQNSPVPARGLIVSTE